MRSLSVLFLLFTASLCAFAQTGGQCTWHDSVNAHNQQFSGLDQSTVLFPQALTDISRPISDRAMSCTGTAVIPQGRKFVVLQFAEEMGACGLVDRSSTCNEQMTATVTAGNIADSITVHYPPTGQAQMPNPPPDGDGPWTVSGELTILRIVNRVYDVTALTANGPANITVTINLPEGDEIEPLQILGFAYVKIWGDIRFRLTQAPSSFRPRDSRDAAADCGNHGGDCWLTLTAEMAASIPIEQNNLYEATLGGRSLSRCPTLLMRRTGF